MSGPTPPAGAAPAPSAGPPAPPPVSTARLVAVLAGGGAFAGLLLVVAFLATRDAIAAHKALVLEEGILEVLGAPPRYETLWVREGSLVAEAPADPARAERIWRGVREDGSTSGWAIQAKGVGFADDIRLIFGYDATSGRVLGFRVLELKETPGLGDGIAKDASFTTGLTGARVPLTGIKPGVARDAEAGKVHTITGATISSRAVLRIVNGAVTRWAPRIEAWSGKGPR